MQLTSSKTNMNTTLDKNVLNYALDARAKSRDTIQIVLKHKW